MKVIFVTEIYYNMLSHKVCIIYNSYTGCTKELHNDLLKKLSTVHFSNVVILETQWNIWSALQKIKYGLWSA